MTNNESNSFSEEDNYISTNSNGDTILISKDCIETFPCLHDVVFKGELTKNVLGNEIYTYLNNNSYTKIVHFEQEYKYYRNPAEKHNIKQTNTSSFWNWVRKTFYSF